jgi:hypothetical protein
MEFGAKKENIIVYRFRGLARSTQTGVESL